VGRATVYRHWPDRTQLLHDVLAAQEMSLRFEPTGDVRSDLLTHLGRFSLALADEETSRVITALIDRSLWEDKFREVKEALVAEQAGFVRDLLSTAVDAGVVRADMDISRATAQLLGPITYRQLFSGQEVTPEFVAGVVDDVLSIS